MASGTIIGIGLYMAYEHYKIYTNTKTILDKAIKMSDEDLKSFESHRF